MQVYQLGRAFVAVFVIEGAIHAAREHALQVIAAEEKMHIFWEIPIQQFFLQAPAVMTWINRIYAFIHIPGSISFLIWLFYYTSPNRAVENTTPQLYQSRRRAMALSNLLAFVIFSTWPCMPPRLLPFDTSQGTTGAIARAYKYSLSYYIYVLNTYRL